MRTGLGKADILLAGVAYPRGEITSGWCDFKVIKQDLDFLQMAYKLTSLAGGFEIFDTFYPFYIVLSFLFTLIDSLFSIHFP